MSKKLNTILITGAPGVGKTTLVRHICEELQNISEIPYYGFYTEEKRNVLGDRSGYDIVSLHGCARGVLAKVTGDMGFPKIGKYSVFVNYFEEVALPILEAEQSKTSLCVIDELGKMELLSKKFENIVETKIAKQQPILATIPIRARPSIPFIDRLKVSETCRVFHITRANRNLIQGEIVAQIQDIIKTN